MSKPKRNTSLADQFIRLFWAARKEHNTLKNLSTPDGPAHANAVAFAKAQGWEWAEDLIESSRLGWTGEAGNALTRLRKLESKAPLFWHGFIQFLIGASHHFNEELDMAIAAYRLAIEDPDFEPSGHAWCNLGNVLAEKGELDEAISAYRKAIEDTKCDSPGDAWCNLGNVLAEKGEMEEAISAYRKAIEDPKFEYSGDAWNNLGNLFADNGESEEAIRAYHNALEDPQLKPPGLAWYNLGHVYAETGQLEEAAKAYRKAIEDPTYETPGNAWVNLGVVLADKGEMQEAIAAYRKAIELGGEGQAFARFRLSFLEANIKPEALSMDDRALLDNPARPSSSEQVEDKIVSRIFEAGQSQYDKYWNDREDSSRDNTLSILRGWSSAVTLLEGSERLWRGGGYFLKWRGHGVVIDPGFDFLRNFHDAGFHGREIRAVLVSHNHPDHNRDLKDIDDLYYEMWKRGQQKGNQVVQPYVLLWDEDTAHVTVFSSESPEHQCRPISMSSGFPQPFDFTEHESKIPIRVIPFKVNHGNDVKHAMGMVIELLGDGEEKVLRIGYTADTEYFTDLSLHLKECDIVIAHISQPTIDELQDAAKLKSVHLGYRGTAKLLGECQPKLALIGEFWAGLTDLRIPLVKGLQERSGIGHILPSGLGMHMHLPSLDVECTECRKMTPFERIRVAPPADSFGNLGYLCEGCILN